MKYSDGTTLTTCERPTGYKLSSELKSTSGDCNDSDSTICPNDQKCPEKCGDDKDNNCNGKKDEGCKKILHYISGTPQEGKICETIKEPFRVAALNDTGVPQGDIGIGWQITNSPASDAQITQMTTKTGFDGGASAYLKLGSSPGTYTVDSTCAECTEGSPQTFTATAKCPEVPVYYQDNYPYDDYDNICAVGVDPVTKKKYGVKSCESKEDVRYTIAEKGCALTSMGMVLSRYGISYFSPDALNHTMTTDINGYTSEGGVKWLTTDVITGRQITYVDRKSNYGYYKKRVKGKIETITVQKSLMDKYLEKCMPVIVQVINPRTQNLHWIVITEKNGNDYMVNDPDPGNKNLKWLSEYGDIYNIRPYKNQNGGCQ